LTELSRNAALQIRRVLPETDALGIGLHDLGVAREPERSADTTGLGGFKELVGAPLLDQAHEESDLLGSVV